VKQNTFKPVILHMAVFRAKLLKLVFGIKIKSRNPTKHVVCGSGDLLKNIICVKLHYNCNYRLSYRNCATLLYCDKIFTYGGLFARGLDCIMPPKRKGTGSTKVMNSLEKEGCYKYCLYKF
jgi:hypothetical protein